MNWVEQLQEQGFAQFRQYLPSDTANHLRKQILTAAHFKTWRLLTTPYRPLTHIKDRISSSNVEKCRQQQAIKAERNKQFAFSFYRTSNKHAKRHGAGDIHLNLAKTLKEQVAMPLGLSGEIRDSFVAKFEREQFISYHTDGSAGQYAFIYQLSKGWQPKYGGQLVLYPTKSRFYRKVIQPEFNCLTLLKLNHPMPHSVRMLNNPKHKHRLTISGWLE
ncbi:2OG-Fe(II) oxygenase family protein [Thalassotalea atypica]|uniref:2OG-Fe(II) oxygenase family protein n=1 Tax=Thalassotalea atypica TaxID=2054316 RepID=UPI0025725151|nr:2OG-Fe(II) oxygenase family protein [Thalassotalea atypica]